MPLDNDERVRSFGTKVRLFPQSPSLSGFAEPELVWLSPPAGTVQAGPRDDRFLVADAVDKREPYLYPYLPPYRGATNAPVSPGPDGHFDHLPVGSRPFLVVHAYGCLRRVLDIFESYLGRQLPWQFASSYDRCEVIPLMDWDNAQSGFGFMEFGFAPEEAGTALPLALNFDVLAHELGHAILFSIMGLPSDGRRTQEFGAFHEASADLIALLSSMHFDSVLDRLLRATKGNIYALNEINRIAEVSDSRQIRIASNTRKMSEVMGTDDVHDLSRPMTGAIFDAMAYVFLLTLRDSGLIPDELMQATMTVRVRQGKASEIQKAFNAAYANRHFQFKAALMVARDVIGARSCAMWSGLPANDLTYADAASAFLQAGPKAQPDPYRAEFEDIFRWREIGDFQ